MNRVGWAAVTHEGEGYLQGVKSKGLPTLQAAAIYSAILK